MKESALRREVLLAKAEKRLSEKVCRWNSARYLPCVLVAVARARAYQPTAVAAMTIVLGKQLDTLWRGAEFLDSCCRLFAQLSLGDVVAANWGCCRLFDQLSLVDVVAIGNRRNVAHVATCTDGGCGGRTEL